MASTAVPASRVSGGPARGMPELDATEHACWQGFLESSTLVVEAVHRNLVEAHGLGMFDVMMLAVLARSADGSARMGDLADALVLIPSRVTQQARRLEAQGLLRRSVSDKDRRGVVASITDTGRRRLAEALETYAQTVRMHYLGPLSRQQMTALGDSCRRIRAGLTPR